MIDRFVMGVRQKKIGSNDGKGGSNKVNLHVKVPIETGYAVMADTSGNKSTNRKSALQFNNSSIVVSTDSGPFLDNRPEWVGIVPLIRTR